MTESPNHRPYTYPHQNGEVTDEILREDFEKSLQDQDETDKYHLALRPYVANYLDLARRKASHNPEIPEADAQIAEIAGAIEDMQQDIAEAINAAVDPSDVINEADVTAVTNGVLVNELEGAIESGRPLESGEKLAPFVAGALQADGQRVSSEVNPVVRLETDGYKDVVTDSISELHKSDARLPKTGHSVSGLLVDELDSIRKVRSERTLVRDPELQHALHMLENAEEVMDNAGRYGELLKFFDKAMMSVDWRNTPSKDFETTIARLAELDRHERTLAKPEELYNVTLRTLSEILPSSNVTQLYNFTAEDSPAYIKTLLESTPLTAETFPHLYSVVAKNYRSKEAMRNFKPGVDPIIDKLRQSEFRVALDINLIDAKPRDPQDAEEVALHDRGIISHVKNILVKDLGLPEQFVGKFGVAINGRLFDPSEYGIKIGYIKGELLQKKLFRVKACVEAVGVEGIMRLHEKLGIVNLDNYRPEDLQMLSSLLDGDPESIAYLRRGDVAVLFSDAYGDHNGALSETHDHYRRPAGRTLMFEIAAPSDLYRRMIMLKKLGIQPSTLIVNAHGSPGVTHFGGGAKGSFDAVASEIISQPLPNSMKLNIAESQLGRLVNEFMQPSKGRDDGLVAVGKKQIILNSCSSDVEFNENIPSTAETVARLIGSKDVDVYGSSDNMYLRSDGDDVSFKRRVNIGGNTLFEPIGQKVSVARDGNGIFSRIKKRLGVSHDSYTADGRRIDSRRNNQLKIKRTKVQRIFSRRPSDEKQRAA